MRRYFASLLFIIVFVTGYLAGCSPVQTTAKPDSSAKPLRVLATTTIVGDVVKNVGGDVIELSVLLPVGADPHSFQPSPQDVAKVTNADIIFANGAGLEEFLTPLLESSGATQKMVSVSEGIELLQSAEAQFEHAAETPTSSNETPGEHDQSAGDPHLWFDPNNVIVWTQNIVRALSEKDPGHAALFQQNGENYIKQLKELDSWIRQQVNQIPVDNRKLVTDHLVFTYFAKQYGFIQEGAVIPGYSSMAEPSAQDIAALEDTIKKYHIKAIFVGKTVNPALAERVAEDTGIKIVRFYTGSLSEAGGEADTYLKFMRYNVSVIVQALK